MIKIAIFALATLSIARAQTSIDPKLASLDTLKQTLDIGIVVSNVDKAKDFYGTVLGLKLAGTLPMPDGGTMYRYQAGSSTVKLLPAPNPTKYPGGVRDAIGVRLLTLYVNDFFGIVKRWTETAGNGTPPRLLEAGSNGVQLSFITDPDGNQIELVSIPADTAAANLARIAIGLTVSDVDRSRAFYGGVLGLPEEKPEKLALLNGDSKYTFLAGKTQIKFWKGTADNLPKHTGNVPSATGFRYFTFLVKDLDAACALVKSRGAKVVVEPMDFGKIARIMMIEDPDGNWIEFAALAAKKP